MATLLATLQLLISVAASVPQAQVTIELQFVSRRLQATQTAVVTVTITGGGRGWWGWKSRTCTLQVP